MSVLRRQGAGAIGRFRPSVLKRSVTVICHRQIHVPMKSLLVPCHLPDLETGASRLRLFLLRRSVVTFSVSLDLKVERTKDSDFAHFLVNGLINHSVFAVWILCG